jgi:metal-responsive CopG/Arc/MetJ family transcriptional regulator
MKLITLKIPEGMLELWDRAARARGQTRSTLIRESVNKEIEPVRGTPFDSRCGGSTSHIAGGRCRFCRGDH